MCQINLQAPQVFFEVRHDAGNTHKDQVTLKVTRTAMWYLNSLERHVAGPIKRDQVEEHVPINHHQQHEKEEWDGCHVVMHMNFPDGDLAFGC